MIPVVLDVMAALTLIALARKWRWGFVCGVLAQFVWIYFDISIGQYGLLPLALIYGPLYCYGWWNWRAR